MKNKRSDITPEKIAELEKTMKHYEIAEYFGCAVGTIGKIKSGVRANRHKRKATEKKCTACGINYVFEWNYFMCWQCWSGNKNSMDYDFLEAT